MSRYPLWKYLIVVFAVCLGLVYAMPNLYAPDPAIQISGYSADYDVTERSLAKAVKALEKQGVQVGSTELNEGVALIRLGSYEDQLKAQSTIGPALNDGGIDEYIIALNQAPTTPDWLRSLGATPMNLGLDLAGGVHFVLEVDTPSVVEKRMDIMKDVLARAVRKERLLGVKITRDGYQFTLTANSKERQDALIALLREETPELTRSRGSNDDGGLWVRGVFPEAAIVEIENVAIDQNLVTLRNRVNELGVSEPLVQRQGRNRIIVELPGVQDTSKAKKIIGKTANLEFRLEAEANTPRSQREQYDFRNEEEQSRFGGAYLEREVVITGERVVNARVGYDPDNGRPQVNISLDGEGGSRMHAKTYKNVGRRLGVLFIEYRPSTRQVEKDGEMVEIIKQIPVKKIISLATIQSALGKEFRTTGLSDREAAELALLLRAGALAAPMVIVEERTIGPSLGQENIDLGVKSVKLGMLLVVIFMIIFYRVFGIAANIALTLNIILLTGLMSVFGATLTLPGIAGIVLTVGMAVDANVLIFSRIREELKNGTPPQSAIVSGFDRAFTTIFDANITTLIVALILFGIGSGPVKGFAVTLSIGILTSMFTAIMGTRAVVHLFHGNRKLEKLWI